MPTRRRKAVRVAVRRSELVRIANVLESTLASVERMLEARAMDDDVNAMHTDVWGGAGPDCMRVPG